MGFVAIAAVLVAFSVSFASCQLDQLDCAFPDNDDFAYVISNALRSGENPTLATIEVLEFNLLCLAASKERGRYRFFSALVKYRCTTTGGSGCPAGIATEQFESQCDNNGKFSHMVIGQTDNTRRSDPIATFVTQNRRDCALCLSPALIAANSGSTLMTDDTTHCVECTGCSENVGQNSCFGTGPERCCNVYVNDMCDTDCPTTGVFTIDPDTFDCLATCSDLGNNVENGDVVYSNATVTEGRYSQDTTATVSCFEGYSGGGVITCLDTGNWSYPDLPICEIVNCSTPPDLDNGKFTVPENTTFGSTVTYECDTDYIFSDDSTTDTRTCLATGSWSDETIKCQTCELLNCKACVVVDGKATCQECSADFEKETNSNDKCNSITSGSDSGLCILCIVLPIAIILAIILAVAVAIAVYAYYRWKQAPPTKLKEKDPEGLNGVARDNPLYLDPTTVAEEVEE